MCHTSLFFSMSFYHYTKIQAFTALATTCIKVDCLPLADEPSDCKSHAAALEMKNMWMASLIKQLPKDIKALHTREMST